MKELKRICFAVDKDNADCVIHENEIHSTKIILAEEETEALQLKFEREQALWKLGQLQRRFNILFHAQVDDRPLRKHTCEYFIAPTNPPHTFAGRTLVVTEANALALMGDFANKGLRPGISSRERELEGLVEALLRVVEKKHIEVQQLKQASFDNIQHMERCKELQQEVDGLQVQIRSKDDCCRSCPSLREAIAGCVS